MPAPADGSPERPPTLFLIDPGAAGAGPVVAALHAALLPDAWLSIDDESTDPDVLGSEGLRLYRDALRDRVRVVIGRFAFGVDEHWGRPARYAALVREPMARILELHAGHRRRASVRREGPSLEAFVFGQQRLAADNAVPGALAGTRRIPFGEVTEAVYATARENVAARFEALLDPAAAPRDAVDRLGRLLDLPLAMAAAPVLSTTTPARPEASEAAVLDRIDELNAFDRRLYAELVRRSATEAAPA